MTPIALFISGGGGNALNLLHACQEGQVPARPVVAVSSSARALGVQRLGEAGLPVEVVLRSQYEDDAAFSAACYHAVELAGAQLICLCGWLKKLAVPAPWEGRILNIHPALLPAHGGAGMYGMNVHRAVLQAGENRSGATVHVVDGEYDRGRILDQEAVPVLPGDSPEDLQQRVYAAEMRLYPRALAAFLGSWGGPEAPPSASGIRER